MSIGLKCICLIMIEICDILMWLVVVLDNWFGIMRLDEKEEYYWFFSVVFIVVFLKFLVEIILFIV